MIEAFSAFLAQFLGGPQEDAQKRWSLSLRESHARFPIGRQARDAWMKQMTAALKEVPMKADARRDLHALFTTASAYLINEKEERLGGEIGRRWSVQRALDDAVAAIHHGNFERAIELAEGLKQNRTVFTGLLRLLIGHPYVEQELQRDPSLAHERWAYGRTLLHGAASLGNLAVVKLLLRLGAAPDDRDAGGHTPLYLLANGSGAGAEVVSVLVRAGADANARCGSKRCTPLHMAARRGNVEVARALLDCGADPKIRDSQRVTPLQRALNCKKQKVAAILALLP